jgi:hypothetical protein
MNLLIGSSFSPAPAAVILSMTGCTLARACPGHFGKI